MLQEELEEEVSSSHFAFAVLMSSQTCISRFSSGESQNGNGCSVENYKPNCEKV